MKHWGGELIYKCNIALPMSLSNVAHNLLAGTQMEQEAYRQKKKMVLALGVG